MVQLESTMVRRSLSPVARTNGTVNGSAVDTAEKGGCGSLLAFIITGTLTDGVHTCSVDESDDGSTNWTAVAAGGISGSAPVTAITDDDTYKEWGVQPSKRYVRITVVTTGATTGGILAGGFVLVDNRQNPVR